MDKRVYFLMIVSFVIGMVELIINGILDLIANDLQVSIAQAGYLITIFSFIFAIASPILLIMTAKVERKKLTLISLIIFLFGNVVTVFAPSYSILFTGRVITALSGALLIILCLVMAPTLVKPEYRGRAIGIVSMGVSGSLVLGIPIGIVLGNSFGWRAPFVLILVLTVLSMVGVYFLMEKVQPQPSIPLKTQLATFKEAKISLAHCTTFLYMAGHSVLYTYLKPFIQSTTNLDGTWISIVYFLFGIAAVLGGGIGGTLSDKLGPKRTILMAIIGLAVVLFSISYMTSIIVLFLVGLMVWGMMSWVISPAMQSYLIDTSPNTAPIQQSLSNSSLHLGIAAGSLLGGIIFDLASVELNPMIGGLLIALSFVTAIISIRKRSATEEMLIEKQVGM